MITDHPELTTVLWDIVDIIRWQTEQKPQVRRHDTLKYFERDFKLAETIMNRLPEIRLIGLVKRNPAWKFSANKIKARILKKNASENLP